MFKLIYFRANSIRGFAETEFNFSSKYNVTLRETKLHISSGDKNYIDGFYGDDIEINAIVGNNGSGKSSLLKLVYLFLQSNTISRWGNGDNNYIAVFEEVRKEYSWMIVISAGEKNKCYKTAIYGKLEEELILDLSEKTIYLDSLDKIDEDELKEVYNLNFEMLLNLKSVYITQVLDREMYNMMTPDDTNLSTGGLIKADFSLDSKNRSEVVQYFHSVFLNHIDFIDKFCNGQKEKGIKLPFCVNDYVKVSFDFDLKNALLGLLTKDEYDVLEKDTRHFIKNTQMMLLEIENAFKINRDEPSSVFAEALLVSYLTEIKGINDFYGNTVFCTDLEKNYGNKKGLLEFIRHCVNKYLKVYEDDEEEDETDTCDLLKNFLYGIDFEMVHQLGSNNIVRLETVDISERYRFFLNKLLDEFDLKTVSRCGSLDNDISIFIPLQKENNKNTTCALNCTIKDFYKEYQKVARLKMFLDFDWGLSSGEEAMLNLYCKFQQIHNSIEDDHKNNLNIENVILLIDEADMLFHPQWQKDYIKETVKVAKQIFSNVGSVQIFLASHSPIMLSDIPRQNVIYLKKENKESKTVIVPRNDKHETFGANIFRLFQDTFFLDKTGIGSFAEDAMVKLLKEIHQIDPDTSEKEIDRIKKYISIIGDPYIKRNFEIELYNYIEKSNPEKYDKAWRAYLEEQIKLLDAKEEKHDKNQ